MKSYKLFVISVFAFVFVVLILIGGGVIIIDPCFHYHKPLKELYYQLVSNNERSYNDGITKHFDYDAIITGTSMTENFKTSEAERLFGGRFIKIPYSGASFKEINENLEVAFAHNKKIRLIVRALDYSNIDLSGNIVDKDWMLQDSGEYPTYLYDSNPFNDVKYLLNRDVFCSCMRSVYIALHYKTQGVQDFDSYANWSAGYTYGKDAVFASAGRRNLFSDPTVTKKLSYEDAQKITENITQNVTNLARMNPQCTFCYFFPPYSAVWWGDLKELGLLQRQIEIERAVIELILDCPNINLFSFNTEFEIVTDLQNYKDVVHYGEWVNSLMLKFIKEKRGLITKENYIAYLDKERDFYLGFEYNSLF